MGRCTASTAGYESIARATQKEIRRPAGWARLQIVLAYYRATRRYRRDPEPERTAVRASRPTGRELRVFYGPCFIFSPTGAWDPIHEGGGGELPPTAD